MDNNNEKNFDLDVILTVTSGRLFTNIENLYDILNYLTNDKIYTHEIPYLMNIAKKYILSKYPQLVNVGRDVAINNWQDIKNFIDEQKKIYGNSIRISPMQKNIA